MKTKEELEKIKEDCAELYKNLAELSEEELNVVTGGSNISDWFEKIGRNIRKIPGHPSTTPTVASIEDHFLPGTIDYAKDMLD